MPFFYMVANKMDLEASEKDDSAGAGVKGFSNMMKSAEDMYTRKMS